MPPIPRELTDMDLIVGKAYRAKNPLREFAGVGQFNDRLIVNLTETDVQYDSSDISLPAFLPTITIGEFLEWASYEVSDSGLQFSVAP